MGEKLYKKLEVIEGLMDAFSKKLTPQTEQIAIPLFGYIGRMESLKGDETVIRAAENFANAVQSIRFVSNDFRRFSSPFLKACIDMKNGDLRTAKIIIDCASGIIATEKDCEKIIDELEYSFVHKAKNGLNPISTHPIFR